MPLHWKHKVFTAGPPGKSQGLFGYSNILGKNLKTLSYGLWLEHISEAVF